MSCVGAPGCQPVNPEILWNAPLKGQKTSLQRIPVVWLGLALEKPIAGDAFLNAVEVVEGLRPERKQDSDNALDGKKEKSRSNTATVPRTKNAQ
jgi:hypothetical protein